MIYDEPVYRPLGDCMMGVEFGDEAALELNFKVLELQRLLDEAEVHGVVETVPSLRELVVVIDRTKTTNARVRDAIDSMLGDLGQESVLPSRLWVLPCWYDDPWSNELAARYDVENNLSIVARENDLTKEQVVERHTSGEFWVVCVGFTPGCYFSKPLDPSMHLAAPKWETPRDYTPARCLALAGFSTGAYPVASPGGYQLLGRLAVNIYEPHPRNSAFPADGVLLRAGDRIRYRNIGALEYDRIWTQVEAGHYEYEVTEEEFDITAYLRQQEESLAAQGS